MYEEMYRKNSNSWLKHWDFIILDLVALQLAYVSSFVLRMGMDNLYHNWIISEYRDFHRTGRHLHCFLYRAISWNHEKRILCRV